MPETIVTSPDGKKYRVTHPEGVSNDEIYRQLQRNLGQADPPADDGSARLSDIPRGFARGVLGDVRGVAQMAPDWVKRGMRDIPGEASLERASKEPGRSWLDKGSEFAGAAAPFVVGELATGGAATIPGMMAEGALWSGLGAASQPTKEGTVASHAIEGLEGATVGAPLGAAGKFAEVMSPAIAEQLARHAATHGQAGAMSAALHSVGLPWWAMGGPWMWWSRLHHSPLSNLAAEWAKKAVPAVHGTGRALERTAPIAGTGVGQAQEDDPGDE